MQEKTYYVSFVSNIYTHVKQSFNGLYFKDLYNIILTVLKFSSQQIFDLYSTLFRTSEVEVRTSKYVLVIFLNGQVGEKEM